MRKARLSMAATISIAAVAACSSSSGGSSGTASVTGTIQGAAVPSSDAVGLSSVASGGSEAAVGAIITNIAGACGVLQSHGNPPSATALIVAVTAMGGAVATGTYGVVAQGFGASASYATDDMSCNTSFSEGASAGSVTLTVVSGSTVAGTFDLTFGSDHLTGSFSAPVCSYTTADGGATTACQ
jgi:hypothetical protein